MKTYTESHAKQHFSQVLHQATCDGGVQITGRDGEIFVIQPLTQVNSPLAVAGVDLSLSADEILDYVQEGRHGRWDDPH